MVYMPLIENHHLSSMTANQNWTVNKVALAVLHELWGGRTNHIQMNASRNVSEQITAASQD